MMKTLFTFVFAVMLVGCASSNNSTLYQQINGEQGVEKLVDSFINQIGRDEQILAYLNKRMSPIFDKALLLICVASQTVLVNIKAIIWLISTPE